MEKVDIMGLIDQLRKGETPVCPECGKGIISTQHDPKTSHFFSCDKCNFMINID